MSIGNKKFFNNKSFGGNNNNNTLQKFSGRKSFGGRGNNKSPGQFSGRKNFGGYNKPKHFSGKKNFAGKGGNKNPGQFSGRRSFDGNHKTPNSTKQWTPNRKRPNEDTEGESLSAKRKRVSFSSNLEHSRTIDELDGNENSSINGTPQIPSKGILRIKGQEIVEIDAKNLPDFELDKSEKLKVSKVTKAKLEKMDKKARREKIRELKAKKRVNFHLALEAKMLWEKVRSSKCKPAEKEQCIAQLMALVQGKLKTLVHAHDTSRVIECLMALNREDIRKALFDELLPELVHMAKSTYARFFVTKMLKYGTKEQRDIIIESIKGHCVSLLKLTNGAKILELIYSDYANATQRFNIVSEFYGNEFIIFRDEMVQLENLDGILEKHPQKKNLILTNLEEVLTKVVRKETLKLSITHKLLHDYLRHCSEEQRTSMIDLLKTNLPEITHTPDGSRVAMICVWNSPAKERKAIVKSFKGVTLNACKDKFSRRVLFAIFDSVDDTALVNKYITSDISNKIADLIYDKNGVSVLHYLVHPRNIRQFTSWIVPALSEGDSNIHSLKAKDVRYTELFDCVKSNLFAFMAANMSEILMSKVAATLVLNALKPPEPDEPFQRVIDESDKEACFKAIADVLGGDIQPYDMKDQPHILRFGPPRFVFRKLMGLEPKQTGAKISDFIADLPRTHLASFVTLECGCFTLVEVIQSGSEKGKRAVLEAVNLAALKESKLAGARVLLEEITNCLRQKGKK